MRPRSRMGPGADLGHHGAPLGHQRGLFLEISRRRRARARCRIPSGRMWVLSPGVVHAGETPSRSASARAQAAGEPAGSFAGYVLAPRQRQDRAATAPGEVGRRQGTCRGGDEQLAARTFREAHLRDRPFGDGRRDQRSPAAPPTASSTSTPSATSRSRGKTGIGASSHPGKDGPRGAVGQWNSCATTAGSSPFAPTDKPGSTPWAVLVEHRRLPWRRRVRAQGARDSCARRLAKRDPEIKARLGGVSSCPTPRRSRKPTPPSDATRRACAETYAERSARSQDGSSKCRLRRRRGPA